MRNYFEKAARKKGKTGEVLVQQLEARLDAIVLRAGFARTIFAARQYVGHGHIEVNGSRVDIPSYQVKAGDVVSVKEKSQKLAPILEAMASVPPPVKYVERDWINMRATFVYLPTRDEIPVIADENMIVEFYSK